MAPIQEKKRKKEKEVIQEPLKKENIEVEPKTKKKGIEKDEFAKVLVQTKEEEILEKEKKEEDLADEEKEISKKIKKKSNFIGENSLKDGDLINILKEKGFSENRQQILDKLKKKLHNLELDKAFEYIILINVGYFSSLKPLEGSFDDIDFLSFIIKDLLLSEKYYKFGLISFYLILDKYIIEEKYLNGVRYNNFFFNNLLDRLHKNEKEELIHIIIKGTFQNEKISQNYQNFPQILSNHLPIDFNEIKEISFNKFFDMIFKDNKDILEQNREKFKEFIRNNVSEIFTNKNVFTVFKHLYVNFYDKNDPLFQKIDDLIQKSIEDVNNLTQIRELIYCFMEKHWKHSFYEKFYKEYFNLLYELRNRRDIMNMGDLFLLFQFGSLKKSDNWQLIYKPFFKKFLEDFKYFRSRSENNFNVAYEQLEILVGQRPKMPHIKVLNERQKIVDVDKIIKLIFPEFKNISKINITDSDIKNLFDLDDSIIRESLVKILKNNKNLPQNVKNKLKSEAAKPHTPFEISDFEFSFKFEENLYYICFVIKSGREITGESVPISFQYQLKRPFEELENVIVVFLTAKKASEVLKNWIKKHNSKYLGQQIETIEKENFAKLFKIYDII